MEPRDPRKLNDVQILLVEGDETGAELTLNALKKNKLVNKILWVKDGAEALDFIFGVGEYSDRAGLPKVVLLDLKSPKVGGMEALRRMKSDERTKGIPVVVLTSSKEDRDMAESRRLGVKSFISKPVEFENFAKEVSDLGFYWLLVNKAPY